MDRVTPLTSPSPAVAPACYQHTTQCTAAVAVTALVRWQDIAAAEPAARVCAPQASATRPTDGARRPFLPSVPCPVPRACLAPHAECRVPRARPWPCRCAVGRLPWVALPVPSRHRTSRCASARAVSVRACVRVRAVSIRACVRVRAALGSIGCYSSITGVGCRPSAARTHAPTDASNPCRVNERATRADLCRRRNILGY